MPNAKMVTELSAKKARRLVCGTESSYPAQKRAARRRARRGYRIELLECEGNEIAYREIEPRNARLTDRDVS